MHYLERGTSLPPAKFLYHFPAHLSQPPQLIALVEEVDQLRRYEYDQREHDH